MKTVALLTLALVMLAPTVAMADDNLVKFKGGIGVHPISNVTVTPNPPPAAPTVTVTRNTVRGVDPAGQLWEIADLKAEVKSDGRIKVDGRGLVLAGGNTIGMALSLNTTTGVTTGFNVIATLVCETVAVNFTQRSTNPVPLAANGDFKIDDVLAPWPPASCATPVLLIRNAAGTQGWFAAGILKFD